MTNTLKVALFLTISSAVVFFQNCSPTQFAMPTQVVDANCSAADCIAAASTIPPSANSSSSSYVPTIGTSVPTPPSNVSTGSSTSYYNFVAGDQQTCQNSIQQTLGKSVACTIGGGCGIACGAPGSSCMSANPGLWGACVTSSGATPAASSSCQPAGTLVAYQNCQGGSYPSSEVQTNTQGWSGCCSGTVKRTCGEPGYSPLNPIVCQ